jgi:FtsZ-interacting cell division protein ZipA
MPAWAIALIVIGAVVVVALVVMMIEMNRRRTLRARFGPEYDRMVDETGSERRAASVAKGRISERQRLEIHPLAPASRDRYSQEWRQVQARFVDAPSAAVGEADSLVTRMMHERGYPIDDFEHQAALVSVDHPGVVNNYREGHTVYLASVNGTASTEDMRRGFVAYRSLFGELLDDRTDKGAA